MLNAYGLYNALHMAIQGEHLGMLYPGLTEGCTVSTPDSGSDKPKLWTREWLWYACGPIKCDLTNATVQVCPTAIDTVLHNVSHVGILLEQAWNLQCRQSLCWQSLQKASSLPHDTFIVCLMLYF